jgi:serine/threonine-protein kinase HipA
MPSKKTLEDSPQAYVWIWLPTETEPVVAGRIQTDGEVTTFIYGQTYLQRPNAISIYNKELPLEKGAIAPLAGLQIAGAIRDAAPDAWGRRVILNRKFGKQILGEVEDPLTEINYLLESGSDRIGALDFQASATTYVPRANTNATLEELLTSADRVDQGIALTPELDQAIHHGSSIGGARPKALIDDGQKKFIAKFSSTSDTYDVVKTEFVAMRLAELSGIYVAPVHLKRASGKDVLLIERFDRIKKQTGYERVALVSALTLLELNEMVARHASYQDLAEIVRTRFSKPKEALHELYKRLIFNVLIGNNDDHARNHAALWDGTSLTLSPAYDLCPQKRSGRESNQAMYIFEQDRTSRLQPCLLASKSFLVSTEQAIQITEEIIKSITKNFDQVCKEGRVSEVDQALMKRTQFLTDYAFEGLTGKATKLALLKK